MSDNNSNNYIAITIGPIMDTMSISSKPTALWLSSYMFSYISKSLCEKIATAIGEENIITPYFPKEGEEDYKKIIQRKDGVGLFHDHIIFKEIGDVWDKLNGFINDKNDGVIAALADNLGVNYNELKKYLMIKACRFDCSKDENPILRCGVMLDSMELPKVFNPIEEAHPVKNALKNKQVKDIAKSLDIKDDEWSLVKKAADGKLEFKDIEGIASREENEENKGLKKNNYYCLLRADGDNMSKIISKLGKGENKCVDEACREFSRVCLNYCSEAASLVNKYGGITIYAGGDDLLALVPCEGKNNTTVFGLIGKIDEKFNESFKTYIDKVEEDNKPSLSFGALICHVRYPLYEALNKSAQLLFDVAKKKNGEKKNCVALQLQKHSGQSEELILPKNALKEVSCTLDKVNKKENKEGDDSEEFLLSAGHKLITFSSLIGYAGKEAGTSVESVFENIFDSGYHHNNEQRKKFLHETLPKFYSSFCVNDKNDKVKLLENDVIVENPPKALGQILRVIKFFIEKGDE